MSSMNSFFSSSKFFVFESNKSLINDSEKKKQTNTKQYKKRFAEILVAKQSFSLQLSLIIHLTRSSKSDFEST